jgi:hypothetical protein
MIVDEHGQAITEGVSDETLRQVAKDLASDRGRPVYAYANDQIYEDGDAGRRFTPWKEPRT